MGLKGKRDEEESEPENRVRKTRSYTEDGRRRCSKKGRQPLEDGKDKNMDYRVLENFNVKLCSKKQNTNCHVTQSVQFSRSVVSDSL